MYTDIVSIKTEKNFLFYLPLDDYKDKKMRCNDYRTDRK